MIIRNTYRMNKNNISRYYKEVEIENNASNFYETN